MSDIDIYLIKKCVEGDINSFEKLISKHEKNAFSIALRYLGDYDDACDVAQESLIKVFKNISKFKFESSFTTWMYRIVINTCKDFLKVKNKEKIISIENNNIEIESDVDVNKNIEIKELKKEVADALQNVTETYRIAVILKDIQEFSYNEISEMLDIPVGTVRSRISRGRVMLKNEMIKSNPDILSMIV